MEEAIGAVAQKYVLPLNPGAAFEIAGKALGYLPASPEFDTVISGVTVRAQVYRDANNRSVQHIVYCPVGAWSDLTWFDRQN